MRTNPDLPSGGSRDMITDMQPVTERLRNFLLCVAVKLINDPGQAQLKVAELGPEKVRFKLVLSQPLLSPVRPPALLTAFTPKANS